MKQRFVIVIIKRGGSMDLGGAVVGTWQTRPAAQAVADAWGRRVGLEVGDRGALSFHVVELQRKTRRGLWAWLADSAR